MSGSTKKLENPCLHIMYRQSWKSNDNLRDVIQIVIYKSYVPDIFLSIFFTFIVDYIFGFILFFNSLSNPIVPFKFNI